MVLSLFEKQDSFKKLVTKTAPLLRSFFYKSPLAFWFHSNLFRAINIV